jgi:hypothetical protein
MNTTFKNIIKMRYLAIPFLLLTVFASCKKDAVKSPILDISVDSAQIAAGVNSTIGFDITSNTSWLISSSQSWLMINKTSGTGNASITLTASANNTSSIRKAVVTVTSLETGTKIINVFQSFVPASKPNWAIVNNINKEFSITYIAQVSVNNEIQPLTEGDELAAFIGNQCRGIATIVSNDNKNYFYILIYGNQNDTEKLLFKYYSKQRTWIFENKPIDIYYPNQSVGSLDTPFIFEF